MDTDIIIAHLILTSSLTQPTLTATNTLITITMGMEFEDTMDTATLLVTGDMLTDSEVMATESTIVAMVTLSFLDTETITINDKTFS